MGPEVRDCKLPNDATFFSGQANTEVIDEFDEHGRPKQKVALLHGPPGTTTC